MKFYPFSQNWFSTIGTQTRLSFVCFKTLSLSVSVNVSKSQEIVKKNSKNNIKNMPVYPTEVDPLSMHGAKEL